MRDGWRCIYCRATSNLTLDHRIPTSRWPKNEHGHAKPGCNDPANLCCCCERCNNRKGARTEEEFRACNYFAPTGMPWKSVAPADVEAIRVINQQENWQKWKTKKISQGQWRGDPRLTKHDVWVRYKAQMLRLHGWIIYDLAGRAFLGDDPLEPAFPEREAGLHGAGLPADDAAAGGDGEGAHRAPVRAALQAGGPQAEAFADQGEPCQKAVA